MPISKIPYLIPSEEFMNYTSTRDNKVSLSASKAILQGSSHDGGLFVPEVMP